MFQRDAIEISERISKEKLIPHCYYPSFTELSPIYNMLRSGDIVGALLVAFRLGFYAGNHATIKRGLKRI